jgi:hypothetical protein
VATLIMIPTRMIEETGDYYSRLYDLIRKEQVFRLGELHSMVQVLCESISRFITSLCTLFHMTSIDYLFTCLSQPQTMITIIPETRHLQHGTFFSNSGESQWGTLEHDLQ